MTTSKEVKAPVPIDVPRDAIADLYRAAIKHIKDNRGGQAEVWWDGYIRALEHVLEMEGQ